MRNLNELLDEAAHSAADRVALATQSDAVSFAELRRRTLAAAAGLRAAGIGKGDRVAIVHRNHPMFVEAYFAVVRLGAVAVPINFMIQKPAELAYMLNDCGVKGIVTQKEFLKGLREAATLTAPAPRLWVTDGVLDDLNEGEWPFTALLSAGGEPPVVDVDEGDIASILYTSGTTGNPKGVMLTHRNLVTNCEASIERMGAGPRDVALCLLPMFHSFAWTGNVLVSLRLKIKLVIAANIAPPKPWLALMARHGVTIFVAVPQIFSVLAKQAVGLKGMALKWWFFRKVRVAVSGAAPLNPAVLEDFRRSFGLPILEGYGLTETTPVVSVNPPGKPKAGSVGTPIRGVRVKIVDETERELPVGEEGEICVFGDCVMKGYYNLPDATRQAFTADGWLKTGDIGALDAEGYLFIRDRLKDMIIVKGLKVFPAQVEAVLLENPDIEEAAVIGIPDEHGDETIKAFVVLRKGSPLEKAGIMRYCREKFDPYKRPRDVELVDSLPKNALGKVLKRSLRARGTAHGL